MIVADEDEEAQESQEFPEVIIESDEESAQERPYSYSLKVIRPRSQGGSVVEKFQAGTFLTPHDIEVSVKRILKDKRHMIDSEFEFGYMDVGHGVKGKQYALETNDDVTDMYEMYGRKKTRTVVLWAKVGKTKGARKRLYEVSDSAAQSDGAPPTSKKEKRGNSKEQTAAKEQVPRRSIYQNHVNKMSELEEIIQELEKRQIDGKYTSDQIRVWAHMIQIKKHSSYDKAPDKPFFKVPGSSTKTEGISPAKRITLRSECIDQLEKWHKLMERGAISMEQYKELQDTIMGDIKKF